MLRTRDWIVRSTATPRRWLSPVTEVTSGAAVAVALVTLVGGLVGWRFGWLELLLGFWLGLALLAVCALFVLGRHQLSARFDLGRDRVVVGERANGAIFVSNGSRRRSLPVTIELPVGRGSAAFHVPSLKVGDEREELFAIPTQRRAIIPVGPVLSVRSDPFALFRREQPLTEDHLLYVHPRTVRIESSATGLIRDLEGQTVRKLSNSDVAFHALRPYVPGDDRRYIHWKSTARTGTLMVRQFEETRRSHLLVALSTRLDDYGSDEEFEVAVSVAGSLGVQCLGEGQTLSGSTSTRRLRTPTVQQWLDQLSGVEYEPTSPRLSELVRRLVREVSGASVAVLVCGSLVDPTELRRARRFLPVDVRTIVVQARPGGETSVHPVGDLDIAVLGDLDDLAPTMRRLAS
ncbi:DUF58 domain-containing protein [Aeromicrobium sp. Leaf350]|uniref:DUF58 domain-containing protein n=1 Tax=Aeromicrobium sp. Leaf350 TaxID=2876565 RepID=UPI001E60A298|nr:DUF58 domain-containing protein [Aeromicrobium sp. Leaf350]